MDYRVGKCSSCGARYKIPATFQGDKAKCKSCSGVVEVGPVQTPGQEPGAQAKAKPIPARKPAPKPADKPAAKKERSGPSMKEKLKAQSEGDTAPAAKPKEEPKATRSSSRRAATPRRERAGAGDEEPKSASRRSSARASSRGGSRRSARDGGADDDGEERPRRGGRQQKKANPAVFLGAIVLFAIIAFGAWKFLDNGDDVAAGNGDTAVADAGDSGMANAAGTTDETGSDESQPDASGGGEAEEAADTSTETGTEGTAEAATEGAAEAATDTEAATEAPKKPKPEKVYDPSTVDLSVYNFEKDAGSTDEEWADLQELAATMIDPLAGAAGSRAQKSLVEAGKAAMPAIINQLLAIDFSSEEGYRNGDICQKKMMEICNGINLGWKYSTTPKDQVFNKKVALGWAKNWDKCVKDPAYWIKFAKLDKKDAPKAEPAISEDELDDLDDL